MNIQLNGQSIYLYYLTEGIYSDIITSVVYSHTDLSNEISQYIKTREAVYKESIEYYCDLLDPKHRNYKLIPKETGWTDRVLRAEEMRTEKYGDSRYPVRIRELMDKFDLKDFARYMKYYEVDR